MNSLELAKWLDYGLLTVAKATLVLGIAFGATWLLRRRPAAERHAIWLVAVTGAALLPLIGLASSLDFNRSNPADAQPTSATFSAPATRTTTANDNSDRLADETTGSVIQAAGQVPRTVQIPRPTTESLGPALLILVWLSGAVSLGFWRIWGLSSAMLLPRRRRSLRNEALLFEAERLRQEMGIERRVTLLEGGANEMPKTAGLLSPWILLPNTASEWTIGRLESVMRHELAHVRRRDSLSELMLQLATVLYWFHPLVWYGARRTRDEREHACDDIVLLNGTRSSEYASDLIAVAQSMTGRRLVPDTAVAMARPTRLWSRLTAILDEEQARAPRLAFRRLAGAVGVGVAMIALIGAAGPSPRDVLSLRLTRTLLIDGHSLEIGDIGAIVADDDGRIYVADVQRQANRIVVLDRTGRQVASFGGRGSGPGEFTYLAPSLAFAGANLMAVNSATGQITYFDQSGRVVSTHPWPSEKRLYYYRLFSTGQGVTTVAEFNAPMAGISDYDAPRPPRIPSEVHYQRLTAEGAAAPLPLSDFDQLTRMPRGVDCASGDRQYIRGISSRPFEDRGPLLTFLPGGEMALAHRNEYVIEIIDSGSGQVLRRNRRDITARAVTDSVWEAQPAHQAFATDGEGRPARNGGPPIVWTGPGRTPCLQRPALQNVISTLLSDEQGRLWVESPARDGYTFTGISSNGELLGDAPMPNRDPEVTPFVHGNNLYLVTKDELDVQSIEVYRLVIE